MELREYAESIVRGDTLAAKLRRPPGELSDNAPGPALRIPWPARPAQLPIAEARAVKVPPVAGMQDVSQRRRILHALANHELQAVELFAWTLLAFPDEPAAFRRGLLAILIEEQEHCELYLGRLAAFGASFGDYPVTGHFWRQLDAFASALDFVCIMGLTFENANLDFAEAYAAAAREVGDVETAEAIDIVHRDEIRHVAFAWRWLQRMKPPEASAWQTFESCLSFPLSPARARGATMTRSSREQAGLDAEFIDKLERAQSIRPNGRPR